MEFQHYSVLLKETVDLLNVNKDGIYADLTLGGGGHSSLILERGGKVIGVDQDDRAIDFCKDRFKEYGNKFIAVRDNFSNITSILESLNISGLDGVVMDLGVSTPQLMEAERGFSYMQDAPLDMRMDRRNALTAREVVNTYSEKELFRIIADYGEERWASRIAKFIVDRREKKPIESTFELVDIIKASIPAAARREGPHPAKRTFQAIRIEVNGELRILEKAVKESCHALKKGGIISIITFHSLEDRIVKNAFNDLAKGCICPKDFPVCVCNNKREIKVINKKPILPSASELEENPASRSSKLRSAEKII